MAQKNQTAIELLLEQHQQVRSLFKDLKSATGKELEEKFQMLVRMLAVHETAEGEVIWPTVRTKVPGGDGLAKPRLEEEGKAKTALSELEKIGPGGEGFDGKLKVFNAMVEEHATHEEQE